MIQPSGLRGLRHATTKPATAKAAEYHTGTEPPVAFTLWRASPESGGSAIINASTTLPSTTAILGDTRRELRLPAFAGPGALRAGRCAPPTNATLAGGRSGNVTARRDWPESLTQLLLDSSR